jgi:hypothetical protein
VIEILLEAKNINPISPVILKLAYIINYKQFTSAFGRQQSLVSYSQIQRLSHDATD